MHDPLTPAAPKACINTSRVVINSAVIRTQRRVNHDTFELVIRTHGDANAIYPRGGQFMVLRFPGIERPRAYSLARDPAGQTPGEYTFWIRQVEGGEVSAWLAAADRSGTEIELAGPLGRFGLDAEDGPMLCIAGGSGISALLALLEDAARRRTARDCWLYHGVRTAADLCGVELIEAVAAAWPREHKFYFVPVLSEEPVGSDWEGARGLVAEQLHADVIASGEVEAANCSAFLCGPPPMIAAANTQLTASGVAAARIHRDVFEDARSPAPVIDNQQCVLCDECLLVKPVRNCIVETTSVGRDAGSAVTAYRPVDPLHSSGLYYSALVINAEACIRCYACIDACPHGAIDPGYRTGATLRAPLA